MAMSMPYRSHSSQSARSPTPVAPMRARRSPPTSSGKRLLAIKMFQTSRRRVPPSYTRSGGMRMVSCQTSVASGS